jgi:hypothetical protein
MRRGCRFPRDRSTAPKESAEVQIVIARSAAMKQSSNRQTLFLDWLASLAMTTLTGAAIPSGDEA